MTVEPTGRGILRAGPEDFAELAEFHARNRGPERQVRADWFAWRFGGHPLAAASGPELWACRRDGRIVGHQAGLPVLLEAGGEAVPALWAVDLLVEREWRMRGVAPALTGALVAGNPVVAGLGISEAAWKAFRRAGWHDLGLVPLWWRLLGPLPPAFAGKPLARVAGLMHRPLALADGLAVALLRSSVEAIPAFDDRADAIWQDWPREGWVVARRDLAALRWRFDHGPAAFAYRRFLLSAGGRVRGYFVLRTEDDPVARLRRATLVDFLCPPRWTGALLLHALAQARADGACALACLSAAAVPWLRLLGFLRRPGYRLMVRAGPQAQPLLPRLTGRWYVTFADSDLDHR